MREPEIDDLELLERSCSMFVLRYLLHHPRKNKTEIMSTEGRNLTTKNRRIDELLAYNLLEVEEGYRRETIYSLSDRGRRIAEHLDAISTILDEIRPGMSEEGDVYESLQGQPPVKAVRGVENSHYIRHEHEKR